MSHRAGTPRSGDASKAIVRSEPTPRLVNQRGARGGADMSHRAGSVEAWRRGTSAAEALQCAGFTVLLRWHGRFAGAPRSGDASKAKCIFEETRQIFRTSAEAMEAA